MAKLILQTSVTTTRQFLLLPPTVTIGRAKLNDVVLDSTRASRFHAVFEINDPFVILRDLGGRNGTWVNGERIDTATTLAHGDTLVMGDSQMRFLASEIEVVDDADLRLLSIRGDLIDLRRR